MPGVDPSGRHGGAVVLGRLCGVLCAMVAAGCSRTVDERLPFSGQVTFQGVPLEAGVIELVSADGGRQGGGRIVRGEFSVPATRGLPPGNYLVRITAIEEAAAAAAGPPGPEAAKHTTRDVIPAAYNSKSTLSAEVKSGAGNRFVFDLK